jgi:histidinol-phosphate phosphatase family protein
MGSRAVFLDKDGTLVEDVPYSVDVGRMRLTEGAATAARTLHEHGFALIVVSNQSGVARGLFEERALHDVAERLRALLDDAGAPLLDFLYCPHHPEGSVAAFTLSCACRKPAPGMIARAALRHDIDVRESWMVGDILDDVEAGRRAGCRTVLVDNGHETHWVEGPLRRPDLVASDLDDAARRIVSAGCRARA